MNLADIIKQSKHKAITAKIRTHLEGMHGKAADRLPQGKRSAMGKGRL